MARAALLDINQHGKKWCCAAKYYPKLIYIEYTVLWTTSHLTFHGMVKSLASISLEHLDVIYTPSHHLLNSFITEHNKVHSWVTKTEDPQ